MRTVLQALLVLLSSALMADALAADELVTTDGTRLSGTFDKLEAGEVHFTDKTLGAVHLPADKVAKLTLDAEKQVRIRRGADIEHQEDAVIFTKDGELYVRAKDGQSETAALRNLRGINEAVPDTRALWSVNLIGLFGWTEGNTNTIAMGFRGDAKRETAHNVQGIYAEGNYLQDNNVEEQKVRRRDYATGYYYRYVFKFRLTIDLTEDLTFNELAGYHWRSITGFGPGYYFIRDDTKSLHAGLHLTYTYEDLIAGADNRGYWGARARAEFDCVSTDKLYHMNIRSELMLDFAEFKNVVVNTQLMAEARPEPWLSAGLLVRHSWDNMPTPGFFHHDLTVMFTIGLSWSGRWV